MGAMGSAEKTVERQSQRRESNQADFGRMGTPWLHLEAQTRVMGSRPMEEPDPKGSSHLRLPANSLQTTRRPESPTGVGGYVPTTW